MRLMLILIQRKRIKMKLEISLIPALRNGKCQKCGLVIPQNEEKVCITTRNGSLTIKGGYHKTCFYLDYKEVLTDILCKADGSIDIKRENERLFTTAKEQANIINILKKQLNEVTIERDRCLRIHNESINAKSFPKTEKTFTRGFKF